MSENLENLTPGLAIRLKALTAPESPEIEKMSEAEFAEYWKTAGHHISPKVEKAFKAVLEDAETQLRLQDAREKFARKTARPAWLDSIKGAIDAMPLAEVIKELREKLSTPGMGAEVYARKLEETPEEDLRSMLLDLERAKKQHGEGSDNSGPGTGV